jgi:hypothetical protein
MKHAPGFSRESNAAFTSPLVSGARARCTLSASHEAATLFRRRDDVHAKIVRPGRQRQRIEISGPRSEMPAPDRQVHPEGPRAQRHLAADAAVSQQAERPALEAGRLRVLLLVPSAGAQVGHAIRMRRSSDSSRPKASSATATALRPGQFDT